jgi:hypothetical protein
MSSPQRLADLQQWMIGAITSRSDERSAASEAGLLPSRRQSAQERLGIYQHAYWARLVDCMRELFPVLSATLERKAFDALAAGYLERYPPSSYTLNHLADRFGDFLTETRPAAPSSPDWPEFVVELARLEHAIDEVFDGPGIEDLPTLDLSGAFSQPASLRFAPAPCLRLLAFAFPVNDFYTAAGRGGSPRWPAAADSYLAVTRRDYVVRRVPLEEAEYRILQALVEGRTLADALAEAGREITPGQAQQWFAAWGRLSFFIACRR